MAGLIGGHRILPDTIPVGILMSAAMDQVLNRIFEVTPLDKLAIAVTNAATTTTVSEATAVSTGPSAAGIVNAANETIKEYANVGLLAANGDPIIGPNSRPMWGRITSVTGAGPYTYTISFFDVTDMTTAAPAAVAWNTSTMGATIGIVELPNRLSLTALSQVRGRKKFQGLDFTEVDTEVQQDLAELFAKAGIPEGGTINYTNNRYITDGQTLVAAIDAIDNQLFTTTGNLTTEISNRTTATNELYAKAGIAAGVANNYAFNNYVVDGDTLLVAIGKLDNNLKTVTDALATRVTTLESANTANGLIVDNETPTGTIASGTLAFTIAFTPKAGSTHLEAYGLSLVHGVHYSVSGTTLTYVTGYEPVSGETHRISYRR